MKRKENIRYNLIISIIYIIGIIFILNLFNMQIINGEEYRKISDSKLTKKADIKAARGVILDRTGKPYANTILEYGIEYYKTKIENDKLNELSLTLMDILEEGEEEYISTFPIQTNPFKYRYLNEEELMNWKKENGIPKQAEAAEAFQILKEKNNIITVDDEDTRKILEVRENIKRGSNISGIKLADNIKRETVLKISEHSHKLPGINITTSSKRVYDRKTEASHVIGYIAPISDKEYEEKKGEGYRNDDKIGKTGIERTFEKLLKGKDGTKQIDMTADGNVTGEYITKEAIGGANIILTIDQKLQGITERALINNLNKLKSGGFGPRGRNPKGASVVVLNVNTGEILSMVSYPSYDPSKFIGGISDTDWKNYSESPLSPLLNRSIQSVYAPGSTFKMVSALAALESENVGLNEKIQDKGVYPLAHRPECWIYTSYGSTHGWLNATGAIKHSCNYYFYEAGNRMGADIMSDYAKYFGLGKKTGVELMGEVQGSVANKETAESKGHKWTQGSVLSAAIGQSYNSFTPLQISKYIAMLANGGKQIKPTLIKSVIKSNGTHMSREEIDKVVEEAVGYKYEQQENYEFKKENIDSVLKGMRAVNMERGGTAYNTFGGLKVSSGGKTGTAEAGPYINGIYVGFAPYEKPEIAVCAVVENGYEGTFVAEIVRDIFNEYFGINIQHIKENMSVNKEGEYFVY